MRHPFFQNSTCRNSYMHRFNIVGEYPEGVMEVCQICGTKKFFKIVDGKVNNSGYMSWHQRQGFNPIHPLFSREFPNFEYNGKI